jgi:hypothetical protein
MATVDDSFILRPIGPCNENLHGEACRKDLTLLSEAVYRTQKAYTQLAMRLLVYLDDSNDY